MNLTTLEQEVLEMARKGYSVKKIAGRMTWTEERVQQTLDKISQQNKEVSEARKSSSEDIVAYTTKYGGITVAQRAELVYRIQNAVNVALIEMYQRNRFGNMVERYGASLRLYTNIRNLVSETFNHITTGIYEGRHGDEVFNEHTIHLS